VSAALEINNLVVRYGTNEAVSGLTLECEAAAVTAIVGPNGAGKTTTVETCEGYRRPYSGSVRVLGLDPVSQAEQLHPRIGVMLQSGGVPSGAKAAETIAHFAKFYAHPQDPQQLLDLLGLDSVSAPYRRMSGGEQQRLKFAIALVGRPELVFLDEPTAGLDAHAKRIVWDVVNQLRENGVSVVLTTHLMDDVEQLANKVAVVNNGKVVACGSPSELTASAQPVLHFQAIPGIDLTDLRQELPPNSTITEAPAGHYQLIGVTDSAALNLVSNWSSSRAVEVHDISTGRRKLEDVFLELTGDGSDRS
jgi:ABC-2 type transport system ATP-binding protein